MTIPRRWTRDLLATACAVVACGAVGTTVAARSSRAPQATTAQRDAQRDAQRGVTVGAITLAVRDTAAVAR
jgi:hypothetical protein